MALGAIGCTNQPRATIQTPALTTPTMNSRADFGSERNGVKTLEF
jgi:hypothetical protein